MGASGEQPEGAKTGRSLDDEADDAPAPPSRVRPKPSLVAGAGPTIGKRAKLPGFEEPELATLVDEAPAGNDWLHEVKLDGYRLVARIERGRVTLLTRRGHDWTAKFAGVVEGLEGLGLRSAILDGELVALDANGRSSFHALQGAVQEGEDTVYYAFDLLYENGRDLRGLPLEVRRARLAALVKPDAAGPVRLSTVLEGDGAAAFARACELGLEGIVSKRRGSAYRGGRGGAWLKVKCQARQEVVVVGYTDPSAGGAHFGAILIATHDEAGKLVYAGKVGTGFDARTRASLKKKLERLEVKSSRVDVGAPTRAKGVHWVRPKLVAEVAFTEWTRDGALRHPSFQGLRADKPARDVVREVPKHASAAKASKAADASGEIEIAGVRITHPDRVFYEQAGITKGDVARYYEAVAEHALPHFTGRPLALVRCPSGVSRACFFQKHATGAVHPSLTRATVPGEGDDGVEHLVAESQQALVALAQIGALELHAWGSRVETLEHPDRLVFDLDPDPALAWGRVREAALEVKAALEALGFTPFVKTTGGKGLHVVVAIEPTLAWDDAKEFTHDVARRLVERAPERYTTAATKAARKGKIFVDYLRNARTAVAIAAFSTRARAGAPVSLPIAWDELADADDLRDDRFNVANVPALLASRVDPWAGFEASAVRVTAAMREAASEA